MIKKGLLLLCFIALSACTPKIKSNLTTHYDALQSVEEVLWLKDTISLPENSILVGEVKIGDKGFTTKCSYEEAVAAAKEAARASGANILQFTDVKKPNLFSTCYRMKAKLYRNTNATAMANLNNKIDIMNASRLSENAAFARIYFYRTSNFNGSVVGYNIKDENDSILVRMSNGKKFAYTTVKEGPHTFYAKTEKSDSVVVDVKMGQEYFVKCEVREGVVLGRPKLYLVENRLGIEEYEEQP